MKLRTKRKLRHLTSWLLGIITLLVALLISYCFNKLIETIIVIILFYIYRFLFTKQWHADSMLGCFCITSIVLFIIIKLNASLSISILSSVLLTFNITLTSYFVKDYSDSKVVLKYYESKLNKLNTKCLDNLTEDELLNLMPDIREDIIRIVYGYLHKPRTLTSSGYAYRHHISERTLFRYVKQIKEKYESLGN